MLRCLEKSLLFFKLKTIKKIKIDLALCTPFQLPLLACECLTLILYKNFKIAVKDRKSLYIKDIKES